MTILEFHQQHPVRRVVPVECWCGQAAGQADDHLCGECLVHCELQAHREGRPSPRDVELRRQLDERRRQTLASIPHTELRSA